MQGSNNFLRMEWFLLVGTFSNSGQKFFQSFVRRSILPRTIKLVQLDDSEFCCTRNLDTLKSSGLIRESTQDFR